MQAISFGGGYLYPLSYPVILGKCCVDAFTNICLCVSVCVNHHSCQESSFIVFPPYSPRQGLSVSQSSLAQLPSPLSLLLGFPVSSFQTGTVGEPSCLPRFFGLSSPVPWSFFFEGQACKPLSHLSRFFCLVFHET